MSGWLYSDKALKPFGYAAWIVVATGAFMAFMLTPWFWHLEAIQSSKLALRIIGGSLGVLGAPAALLIMFGMTSHCLRRKDCSRSDKLLWFLFFFATAWFGAALYFFSVYQPIARRTRLVSSV